MCSPPRPISVLRLFSDRARFGRPETGCLAESVNQSSKAARGVGVAVPNRDEDQARVIVDLDQAARRAPGVMALRPVVHGAPTVGSAFTISRSTAKRIRARKPLRKVLGAAGRSARWSGNCWTVSSERRRSAGSIMPRAAPKRHEVAHADKRQPVRGSNVAEVICASNRLPSVFEGLVQRSGR